MDFACTCREDGQMSELRAVSVRYGCEKEWPWQLRKKWWFHNLCWDDANDWAKKMFAPLSNATAISPIHAAWSSRKCQLSKRASPTIPGQKCRGNLHQHKISWGNGTVDKPIPQLISRIWYRVCWRHEQWPQADYPSHRQQYVASALLFFPPSKPRSSHAADVLTLCESIMA